MGISICVFCASSNHASGRYQEVARNLGQLIAKRGHTLIYGGGSVGLMGVLAREVPQGGGRIVGVIPERLSTEEIAFKDAEELLVVRNLLAIKNAAAGLIQHLQSERSEVLEFLYDSFDDERFHETVSVRSQSNSQAIAD